MQKKMDVFVIPAKAGIQSAVVYGSRVEPGMTAGIMSIDFDLTPH